MNNADFWASVHAIIAEGFTPEGLQKLDGYAEQFISGKLVYQRFSPQEQHGCSAGGTTNVIASLLSGAETGTDSQNQGALSDYQRECELGTKQEAVIEQWAKAVGLWTECVEESLPQSLGEQIAEGGEAVVYDHGSTLIKTLVTGPTLHQTFTSATCMTRTSSVPTSLRPSSSSIATSASTPQNYAKAEPELYQRKYTS